MHKGMSCSCIRVASDTALRTGPAGKAGANDHAQQWQLHVCSWCSSSVRPLQMCFISKVYTDSHPSFELSYVVLGSAPVKLEKHMLKLAICETAPDDCTSRSFPIFCGKILCQPNCMTSSMPNFHIHIMEETEARSVSPACCSC